MNNKALLDKLSAQLSILEHHIKRLKRKPEELHELDVDLMGEKIKEIYTLIHELQPGSPPQKQAPSVVKEVDKLPMVEVKPEPEIPEPKAPEVKNEQPIVPPVTELSAEPEDKVEEILEEKPATPPVSEAQEESVVESPPVAEENAEPEVEQDTIKEEPLASSQEPEAPPVPTPQPSDPEHTPPHSDHTPKTTADLFSGPTTIADSFQAGDDNSLAAKVNPTATQDLKMAIGINDKFLFINELFKGDPAVYNQAIDNLNTVGGVNEAKAAIESFRGEYAWSDNSEAYHRLKKIVMSKYNG